MKNILNKFLGTSPRTTIMGFLTAISIVVAPIIQDGNFDIHNDWKNLLAATAAAIWGRLQKDSNGITAIEGKELHETVAEIKPIINQVENEKTN